MARCTVNWEKVRLVHRSFIEDEAYPSHVIWLSRTNVQEIECMLGKPRVSMSQLRDFGTGMEAYSSRFFNGADAASIRTQRTLISYWLPDRAPMLDLAGVPDSTLSKMLKGSRTPGEFLKFCPMCAKAERSVHGYAVWHLTHQLPLSFVCTRHRQRLLHVPMTHDFSLPPASFATSPDDDPSPFLVTLTLAGQEVFTASKNWPERYGLTANVHRSLCNNGHFRRLEAIDVASQLRERVAAEPCLDGLFPARGIEDGVLEFLASPDAPIDNNLLTLFFAHSMLTAVSPSRPDQ